MSMSHLWCSRTARIINWCPTQLIHFRHLRAEPQSSLRLSLPATMGPLRSRKDMPLRRCIAHSVRGIAGEQPFGSCDGDGTPVPITEMMRIFRSRLSSGRWTPFLGNGDSATEKSASSPSTIRAWSRRRNVECGQDQGMHRPHGDSWLC